jgi:hypothetical protein
MTQDNQQSAEYVGILDEHHRHLTLMSHGEDGSYRSGKQVQIRWTRLDKAIVHIYDSEQAIKIVIS